MECALSVVGRFVLVVTNGLIGVTAGTHLP
jgi:hypothetical protein